MRFVDEEILIKITDRATDQTRFFKSYLEKNDITVQTVELQTLQNSFLQDNIKLLGRPNFKIDLVFNVFSENRDEAIENFEKMHFLFDMVKPTKYYESSDKFKRDPKPYEIGEKVRSFINSFATLDQAKAAFAAAGKDFEGEQTNSRIKLQLKYLPRLGNSRKNDIYYLFPLTISCTPNTEMGYIQAPYWAGTENRDKLHVTNNMNMIPISYKVSFSANVVFSYAEATKEVEDKPYELPSNKEPPKEKSAAAEPAGLKAATGTDIDIILKSLRLPANASTYRAFEKVLIELGLIGSFEAVKNTDGTPNINKIGELIRRTNSYANSDKGLTKVSEDGGTSISEITIDATVARNNLTEYKKFTKDIKRILN